MRESLPVSDSQDILYVSKSRIFKLSNEMSTACPQRNKVKHEANPHRRR